MQALRRLLRDILQIGGIAVALHCGGTPLDERVATVLAAKVAADKKVQEALDMGNAADEARLAELQDEQRQDDEEKAATVTPLSCTPHGHTHRLPTHTWQEAMVRGTSRQEAKARAIEPLLTGAFAIGMASQQHISPPSVAPARSCWTRARLIGEWNSIPFN